MQGVLRSPVTIIIGTLLLFSNCAISFQSTVIGMQATCCNVRNTTFCPHSLCVMFCPILTVNSDCLHLSTTNWLVIVMTNCVLSEAWTASSLGAFHLGFESLNLETINRPTTKMNLLFLSYKTLSCYFCLFFITSSLLICSSSCFLPSYHCISIWSMLPL